MFRMCRNVPLMDSPSSPRPLESEAGIDDTRGQEPADALEILETRSSTPGSPPLHRRGPDELSDSGLPTSQPDHGGKSSNTADAEETPRQSCEAADPAEPVPDEFQQQHTAAAQEDQVSSDEAARSHDGAVL